ncbi:MAG: SRPBCC domain-containing protein [Acidobacteria bacterium]|nr:SRPBCC domain-containing protein [Acidobacteriota bacterium]
MQLTRNQIHRLSIQKTPDSVFQALVQPSAIQAWWGAHSAIVLGRKNGVWSALWGENPDDPEYLTTARILIWEPPFHLALDQLQYYAKSGPLGFEASFRIDYRLWTERDDTVLQINHDGFPITASADGFFKGCQQGWADSLTQLKKYLESLENEPIG